MTVRSDLVESLLGLVDRNGESYSHRFSALRKYEGIDPHNLSERVDQRPSRIAGIDGGVGLYGAWEVAKLALTCSYERAPHSAYDSD